jgi:polyhydroxyalkanoate synthesis regulator phasin
MMKAVRNVLLSGSKSKVLSLDARLQTVVQDFVKRGNLIQKESDAKVRELKSNDVVALLNDAAHRLDNWPSIVRVDHILQIVQSIVNTINAEVDA